LPPPPSFTLKQAPRFLSLQVTPLSVCLAPALLSVVAPLLPLLHFRCFSSLSPPLLPASPCRLLGGLLRNILSSPLRASVR
uniref:Uncharacterized protein n=1 Tax=Monopterus albus TaxID=43700 RepID=A0A3Q3KLR2_MONAL